MTETESHSEAAESAAAADQPFAPKTYMATLPMWKKAMIGGAVALLVVAAVTIFLEDPAAQTKGVGAGGMNALDAGQGSAEGAVDQVPWSQAFFKFGFSFFIGFAVGYAARAFLKMLLFIVGALAICLFLLSYLEFVAVNWQAMDDAWGDFGNLFQGQFAKFRTFITGSLPSAGLAGLGLFTGFKKNG